jgi:pimeloyl-ACP methyl ester carboxylesterase
MGGGISIIKAAEDTRVKKLITLGSVGSFRNLWPKSAEEQWRLQGIMYMYNSRTQQQMPVKSTLLDDLEKNANRFDILSKAAAVNCPWLLMHGDADTTVNVSHAKELKKAQPNAELVVVKHGDHTFGGTHPYQQNVLPQDLIAFAEASVAFLKK